MAGFFSSFEGEGGPEDIRETISMFRVPREAAVPHTTVHSEEDREHAAVTIQDWVRRKLGMKPYESDSVVSWEHSLSAVHETPATI